MTNGSKNFWWIGLAGALLVALSAFHVGSASRVGGQYVPVGHDSFYHGARVREAIESGNVPQFDERMHAPQGGWVTWPWAYDAVLAQAGRLAGSWFGAEPMTAVAHVPVLLGIVTALALTFVTLRLALPAGLALLALACFGLGATTQYLYGVGVLDHHGAEQLAMLLALGLGMAWRQHPDALAWPLLLGMTLGLALGVHASLVVLQLPLVATLLLGWWRDESNSLRGSWTLAAGLVAGSLAILLPAATFWQGWFDLYYLSWLQVYCSGVTIGVAVATGRWAFSWRRAAIMALVLVAAAIPLHAAMGFSASFLAGDLPAIALIDEIRSPYDVATDPGGFERIGRFYTLLIWLAPLLMIGSAYMAFRVADPARRYFWVWAAFGLLLTMLQQRLLSLGSVFLFLAPIVMLDAWLRSRPHAVRSATVAAALVMLVAYAPTLRHQLLAPRIPAMDEQFVTLRPVLPALAEACARHPGVVLATPGDGHIVRYFTKCGVVSNNFRLTSGDLDRIAASLDLIGGSAAALPGKAPYVDYVLARLVEPAESDDPVLFSELLNPADGVLAPGYRPIVEVGATQPDGSRIDFLGLFAVPTRSPASSPGI